MKDLLENSVQQFRIRSKYTQEELAMKVDVTRQTIIAIEKGNYTPSVTLAIKIARVFKTSVEKLFQLSKEENS